MYRLASSGRERARADDGCLQSDADESFIMKLSLRDAEAEKKAADSEGALQQLRTEKAEAEKKAADSEEALQKLRPEKGKAIKDIEAKLLEADVQHADSLVALQRRYEQQTRDSAGEQAGTEVFDGFDAVSPTVADGN
ncbi:hypothetical protein FOZ63_022731 [Perkinsus olseni]|uniref:Uncharacterized protein n=1 Tax=Perkinsus olseni TaxID=32597 RepID=A0A7J6UKF4_PEROL|nr:hypothetical protein FOZ63_022731 [Perkinsus olseni]